MRVNQLNDSTIKLVSTDSKARAFIDKIYARFPQTWQHNHVMMLGGSGDDQQFAMFELVPSFSKRGAVEVKWFQAYPLRQGVGTRAMAVLQDAAREDGVALTLYPWDKGQVSQGNLVKFYKKAGFRPSAKGAKTMAWEPTVTEAKLTHKDPVERWVAVFKASTHPKFAGKTAEQREKMARMAQYRAVQNKKTFENMDHSKDDRAVPELKAALLARKRVIKSKAGDKDAVYAIINGLMTSVAKAHGISGQKLHDMWVDQYDEIPDTWILHESMLPGSRTPTEAVLARKHTVGVSEIKRQLAKGIKTELEHTTDRAIAREIALDHLGENLYYYEQLRRAGLEEAWLDMNEYGGWITPGRRVEYVEYHGHEAHLRREHGLRIEEAFLAGFVRFQTNARSSTFSIEGTLSALRKTYRIWSQTALNATTVYVDIFQWDDDMSAQGLTPHMMFKPSEGDKPQITHSFGTKVAEPMAEAKKRKAKTIIDGMIKTLIKQGRTRDEAIADLKRQVDSRFYEAIEAYAADQILEENLRDWFKQKWVRFGPDGKIRGDCARGSSSEGKPKCLPQSKAHALGKKGRATAARRKRRNDPTPERHGKAKNVRTKESMLEDLQLSPAAVRSLQTHLNTEFDANLDVDGVLGPLTAASIVKFLPSAVTAGAPDPSRSTAVQGGKVKPTLDEKCWDGYRKQGMKTMFGKRVPNCVKTEDIQAQRCPSCGGLMVSEDQLAEKQDACYYKVKSRYKVWPSAYASGALVQCRKKGAKNWGNSKTKESAQQEDGIIGGKDMLVIFKKMHHEHGYNQQMEQWIAKHSWTLDTIEPDQLQDMYNDDEDADPFERVVWLDDAAVTKYERILGAGKLVNPIIMGPGRTVIDGNHRAQAAKNLHVSIPGYVPVKNDVIENNSVDDTVTDGDLQSVAEWLDTTVDKLNVELKNEPIKKFANEIREMYNSYDEFPEDAQRTHRILKMLTRGAKPLPVYVEKNDPHLFVMEGRHRMVAFMLHGMKTIPVAYVSKRVVENFADGKGPGRPGDSRRHGIPKHATMSELEKASHAKGRKGQLARWQLNMRRGRAKAHESEDMTADQWQDLRKSDPHAYLGMKGHQNRKWWESHFKAEMAKARARGDARFEFPPGTKMYYMVTKNPLEEDRGSPHGSPEHELEMMKAGTKPAALITTWTYDDLYAPIIKQQGWVAQKYWMPQLDHGFYVVGQPDQLARVQRIGELVYNMNRSADQPGPDYHRELGQLLGYTDQHIADFLADLAD